MLNSLENAPFGVHAPARRLARVIGWTRAMPDNWLGRRIAFTLRRWGMRGVHPPVDVEAMGARFRLYPFDNVCERRILFTPQYFDAAERALLHDRLMQAGPGAVFMDVGANAGGYALAVAMTVPGTTVLAIEPLPEIFERLIGNIRQNIGSGVKAIACAVSDRDGEATLFIDSRNRGETGLKFVRPTEHSDGVLQVPAKALLTIAREENLKRIDAVKMDVEGAEDIILEPFFRDAPANLWPGLLILGNAKGRWQIDLPGLLAEKGYTLIARTRLNLVFERRTDSSK